MQSATVPQLHAADYYTRLGLTCHATEIEIKKTYRRLALKYHPDKGGDRKAWLALDEAYQVLSDAHKREQFDLYGEKLEPGVGNEMAFGVSNLTPLLSAVGVGLFLGLASVVFTVYTAGTLAMLAFLTGFFAVPKTYYSTVGVGAVLGFTFGCGVLSAVVFALRLLLYLFAG